MIYFGKVRDEFERFDALPMAKISDTECEEAMLPEFADFWSVYTVRKDNTLDCVADVQTQEQAEALIKLLESVRAL